jgi:hypothetical protein
VEGRLFVLQKFCGRIKFDYFAIAQHDDLVRIENGVQTMGNCQDGALLELLTDGGLGRKDLKIWVIVEFCAEFLFVYQISCFRPFCGTQKFQIIG